MTLLEMLADENSWQEKEDGMFGLCRVFTLTDNEKPWEFFQRVINQLIFVRAENENSETNG